MKTDNYAEFFVPLKNDLNLLITQMEHGQYEEALGVLERVVVNARLLHVWTKDKVKNEADRVELQRTQDVPTVPKAVP